MSHIRDKSLIIVFLPLTAGPCACFAHISGVRLWHNLARFSYSSQGEELFLKERGQKKKLTNKKEKNQHITKKFNTHPHKIHNAIFAESAN